MNKNQYVFRSSNGLTVVCLRGANPPAITGGSGGWEVVPRPRRVALTIWRGRDPYTMDVPVLLDGWLAERSVEQDIARLNQMFMGTDLKSPPTIQIEGAVPVKGIKWVGTIEWGTNVIWEETPRGAGFRYRQDAVLHLVQYNPEKRVAIRKDAQRGPVTYTVKSGDTLRSIAKHFLNDSDRWRDIARAQTPPLRVLGTAQLKRGKVLRIPGA